MAEQVFRSPGFFEREIDLAPQVEGPTGTPAGIIGTAEKGPAFVPVTVGTFEDFKTRFGSLDANRFGPYAVREFLKHKKSLTYCRVLGAGANDTDTDMTNTINMGTVKNAGFRVLSKADTSMGALEGGRHSGGVQFLVARHVLSASEAVANPMFTDNDSFGTGNWTSGDTINLIRAVIMVPSGTAMRILNWNQDTPAQAAGWVSTAVDDLAVIGGGGASPAPRNLKEKFKLVISSSSGSGFATTDSVAGVRVLTASLNPDDDDYISRILNTDPTKFIDEEHYLFADYPVENELAGVLADAVGTVGLLSGSANYSEKTKESDSTLRIHRNAFGRFDTRFTTPRTPYFISQPFGNAENDLFYFETLSDGAYGNTQYKVSIDNVRKSTNEADPYGKFNVLIRKFDDTDTDMQALEQYQDLNLNPDSDRFIAKAIGDYKAYFNFDAEDEDDRRVVVSGKYPNLSNYVRVVMNNDVYKKQVPSDALPFGFRGIPVLKTNDKLTDGTAKAAWVHADYKWVSTGPNRLGGHSPTAASQARLLTLTGSIVPPIPFRFKVTKGTMPDTADDSSFSGKSASTEMVDSRFFWGVKFERMPKTGSVSLAALNPNAGSLPNPLIKTFAQFNGIEKLDTLVTGSAMDAFNNNKFTLARVALPNRIATTVDAAINSNITGTAKEHMIDSAYVRNAEPNTTDYTVTDGVLGNRMTLATLVAATSSVYFNRFSKYAKFSTFFYGGFDGVNMLDKNDIYMNDQATSSDLNGGAASATKSPGLIGTAGTAVHVAGSGKQNNSVASYRKASEIMTDEMMVNVNILAIPGIRATFVTDYAAENVRENGMSILVMDPVEYDEDGNRLYDNDKTKPNVRKTSEEFAARAIDNNYVSTYFPDVWIDDPINNKKVKVPPSIPAIAALAFNDKVSYPWFAPAGFNRGALEMVSNVDVRLNTDDRDTLYDARMNPIATFPRSGYVIFGQKTLQQTQSALDRVNVRRLMLELKRLVINVAKRFVFEQNTSATRAAFVGQVAPLLALVQAQAGIEKFQVICDDTNNTAEDVDALKMNGRIVVVPTRTIEFIAIDFIIDRTGASFV